jgi:hypothetical protein
MLWKKNLDLLVSSPISHASTQFSGYSFVDDTDLITTSFSQPQYQAILQAPRFIEYQFKPLFSRRACYMHAAAKVHTMSLIGQHQ